MVGDEENSLQIPVIQRQRYKHQPTVWPATASCWRPTNSGHHNILQHGTLFTGAKPFPPPCPADKRHLMVTCQSAMHQLHNTTVYRSVCWRLKQGPRRAPRPRSGTPTNNDESIHILDFNVPAGPVTCECTLLCPVSTGGALSLLRQLLQLHTFGTACGTPANPHQSLQ